MNNCDDLISMESKNQPTNESDIEVVLELSDDDIEVVARELDNEILEYRKSISNLTSECDSVDYTLATISGFVAAAIDILFVGKTNFDFTESIENACELVDRFVQNSASLVKQKKVETKKAAVKILENLFKVSQDNIVDKAELINKYNHHLTDLAHHPSLLGLTASILVEVLGIAIFKNKNGSIIIKKVEPKDMIINMIALLLSGLSMWITRLAKDETIVEKSELAKPIKALIIAICNAPLAIKVLSVAVNWCGHLISDVAGSSGSKGKGMGIPGLFIALLDEVALTLPPFEKALFGKTISAFTDNMYTNRKVDFRTELGIFDRLVKAFAKQSIPVIVNEALVRGFYFVRRLAKESKSKKTLHEIDWSRVIPINNPTIGRMVTVSSVTFSTIDAVAAAISWKNGFWLHINYVGLVRTTVAVGFDISVGVRKNGEEKKLTDALLKILNLAKLRVYRGNELVLECAKESALSIEEFYLKLQEALSVISANLSEIYSDRLRSVDISNVETNNRGLSEELLSLL